MREIECHACKKFKTTDQFYLRSGATDLYTTECKKCMKARNQKGDHKTRETELIANSYLNSKGIPTLMGGVNGYAFVDIVAFGCIKIETKHSVITDNHGVKTFRFGLTPMQIKRGLLADFVLLICCYESERTFHLFPVEHPVFMRNGKRKTAVEYVPDKNLVGSRKSTRLVLNDKLMTEHQDRTDLIWDKMYQISARLELSKC